MTKLLAPAATSPPPKLDTGPAKSTPLQQINNNTHIIMNSITKSNLFSFLYDEILSVKHLSMRN
jgi:hypothetical protein